MTMDPKLVDWQNSFRDLTRMVPGSNPTGSTSHRQSLSGDAWLVSNGEFSSSAEKCVQHRICSMCQRNLTDQTIRQTDQTARQTDRQRRETEKRRDRSFVHTWSWVVLVLASLVVCLVAMVICLMMSVHRLQQKVLDIQQHCQRRPQEKHLVLTHSITQSLNHNGTHTLQYSHTVLDNSQLVRKPENLLDVAKLSESFGEVAKRPESEVAKLLSRPVRQSGKGKGKGKVNGSCTNQENIIKFCKTYNSKQEAPAELQLFQENLDVKELSQSRNGKTVVANDERIERSLSDTHAGSVKTESPDGIRSLPGSSRDVREDERVADVHTERHDDQQQKKGESQPDDNNNVNRDDGLTKVDEDNDSRDKSSDENSDDEMFNDSYNWFDVTRTQPLLTRNKRNQEKMNKYCEDMYRKKAPAPPSMEYFANFYDHYNISEFINRKAECFIDRNLPLSPKVCQMATMKYENASSALTLYRANRAMLYKRPELVELTDEINGVFTVKKSGIFVLHLEIILVDEDFNHSVGIFQNNLPTLACRRGGFNYKYPNSNVDVTRFRICTINGVLELKTNDILQIKTIEPHTTVRFDAKPLSVFKLTLLAPPTKKGKYRSVARGERGRRP